MPSISYEALELNYAHYLMHIARAKVFSSSLLLYCSPSQDIDPLSRYHTTTVHGGLQTQNIACFYLAVVEV